MSSPFKMFDSFLHIASSPLSLFRRMIHPSTGWKLFRSSPGATHRPPKDEEHPAQHQQAPPKKKALLIGVRSIRPPLKKQPTKDKEAPTQEKPLKGPHNDVNDMRALLIEVYHYAPGDITTLLDDPNHMQPTRANILKAIDELVKDANPGDSFFFHFAGHSGQKPTNDPEEEDGMNEYILTSDGKRILDDILNKRLVKPLPAKSTLTAVIDSCHSCSMLDLKHFRCNRVFVPWINRGKRRTKTLQFFTCRKPALFGAGELPERVRTLSNRNEPLPSIRSVFASSAKFARVKLDTKSTSAKSAARKLLTPLSINCKTNIDDNAWTTSPVMCASPTPRFCEGNNCSRSGSIDERTLRADVICISSSRDEQKTWEDANGVSMTQIMVKFLRADPHPVLDKLMSHISFTIYDAAYERNNRARQYKKDHQSWVTSRVKDTTPRSAQSNDSEVPLNGNSGAEPVESEVPQVKRLGKNKRAMSLEISNFQNPELSSHFPVDMKTRKWNL
ncbi:caspase domain-containing protein [Pholiota molesta]|nr:caspase domain-containing protein [Pholiota molesta]